MILKLFPFKTLNKIIPRFYFSSSTQQIQTKIQQVVTSGPKCNKDKYTHTTLFKDLGFDSLDQVELVIAMEQTFQIQLTDEQAYQINNVELATKVIEAHLKNIEQTSINN